MLPHNWISCGLAAIALAVASPGFGQTPPSAKGQKQAPIQAPRSPLLTGLPVSALDTAVHLTPDQKTKATAIHDKYIESLRTLGANRQDPAYGQKLRELMQKTNKELEDLLTAEQKAKLPDAFRELVTLVSVGLPMQSLGDLKLTAEQKKKLADIAREAQEKRRTLKPEEIKDRSRDISKEANEKALAVLTSEQREVVEKSKAQKSIRPIKPKEKQ